MMITLYGIPNCDTIKKARTWLTDNAIDYHFHDFKKSGLDAQLLDHWLASVAWETLLNRRGMMWRKVDPAIKDSIDKASARQLMLGTPSIIKRPILDIDGHIQIGFKPDEYATLFNL